MIISKTEQNFSILNRNRIIMYLCFSGIGALLKLVFVFTVNNSFLSMSYVNKIK